MLRFITPVRQYAVELLNMPNCRVKHHYTCSQTNPVRIILHEHTYIMNSLTDCMYLFSIKNNNLMLDSCIEKDYLDDATIFNSGYPYICLPEKEEELFCWEYMQFEDTNVQCTSKIERRMISGEEREVLTVKRTFVNSYTSHTTTECYISGLGLQSKQEITSDAKTHLPSHFNFLELNIYNKQSTKVKL